MEGQKGDFACYLHILGFDKNTIGMYVFASTYRLFAYLILPHCFEQWIEQTSEGNMSALDPICLTMPEVRVRPAESALSVAYLRGVPDSILVYGPPFSMSHIVQNYGANTAFEL